MEARVCNYTHLVYTITHLRCVRLITIGSVKLHTFVLHTLYLLKVYNFTHLLRKNTPLLITHLSTLHTFHTFTHLLDIHTFLNFTHLLNIHTFLCYTPFEYTHLSQFYTPFEYTPFYATHHLNIRTFPNFTHRLNIHNVRPNNSILHASLFYVAYKIY